MAAYRMMVEKIEQVVGEAGVIKFAYVHAAALEEVDELREMVEARL